MDKPVVKGHQIIRVDISDEAQALTELTPNPIHTLDEIKDQTMQVIEEEWNTLPDINAIYPYEVQVDYGAYSVWTLCKVRTFKKDTQTAGWFMGVVSPDEYGRILLADNRERDAVMIAMFNFKEGAEDALKWTAHY
jgi:hypothetical protein